MRQVVQWFSVLIKQISQMTAEKTVSVSFRVTILGHGSISG